MKIQNSGALVTGANRGLGLAFAQGLLGGGARKVYAAARDPASVTLAGVEAIKLDVTKPEEIEAAARALEDVSLLVNNAGLLRGSGFLGDDGGLLAVRAELDTNFFGPLLMSRAFAPILARNGGGAIVNVLSALSWVSAPAFSTYCASKSAAWSLSNGLRNELGAQATQVLALHVGFMDTDMVRDVKARNPGPKTSWRRRWLRSRRASPRCWPTRSAVASSTIYRPSPVSIWHRRLPPEPTARTAACPSRA